MHGARQRGTVKDVIKGRELWSSQSVKHLTIINGSVRLYPDVFH